MILDVIEEGFLVGDTCCVSAVSSAGFSLSWLLAGEVCSLLAG